MLFGFADLENPVGAQFRGEVERGAQAGDGKEREGERYGGEAGGAKPRSRPSRANADLDRAQRGQRRRDSCQCAQKEAMSRRAEDGIADEMKCGALQGMRQ